MTSAVDDASLKLADFGFAVEDVGNKLDEMCGTPNYVAPEIIEGKKYGEFVVFAAALAMGLMTDLKFSVWMIDACCMQVGLTSKLAAVVVID